MSKKLKLVVIGLIVVMVLGVGYLMATREQSAAPSSPNPAPTASQVDSQNTSGSSAANGTAGQYLDYSQTSISRTRGTKILFFHASWCPQCRALEASIQAGPIPANVTIFKVDYDNSSALRQKYGVTLQTTLVKIDDGGGLIGKFVAYDSPTLKSLIEELL